MHHSIRRPMLLPAQLRSPFAALCLLLITLSVARPARRGAGQHRMERPVPGAPGAGGQADTGATGRLRQGHADRHLGLLPWRRRLVPGLDGQGADCHRGDAPCRAGRVDAGQPGDPARQRLCRRCRPDQQPCAGQGAERALSAGPDADPQRQHRQRHADQAGRHRPGQCGHPRAGARGFRADYHPGRCATADLWRTASGGAHPVR